ncbi:MAG TPA: tetratricopeptide repeat protein [Candidatus Binatus sp.]|nr:tetratricopeptide repeat protein [Candidatus Binatus sp.]
MIPRLVLVLVVTLALAIGLVACGGGGAALLDTARLEELQNNPAHARELYQDIVRRFPGSPAARTAEERLRALGAPAP